MLYDYTTIPHIIIIVKMIWFFFTHKHNILTYSSNDNFLYHIYSTDGKWKYTKIDYISILFLLSEILLFLSIALGTPAQPSLPSLTLWTCIWFFHHQHIPLSPSPTAQPHQLWRKTGLETKIILEMRKNKWNKQTVNKYVHQKVL